MGWYKAKCGRCWDSHDGMTCDEFQQRQAANQHTAEMERLAREQNDLFRQQIALLTAKHRRVS